MSDTATVTRDEAARLLRAADRTLRRYVEAGEIQAVSGRGGEQLLSRSDVMRLARARDATISHEEAAALLGKSLATVARLVRSGQLDSVPVPEGRRRRILRASVDAHLADTTGHVRSRQEAARTGHIGHKSDMTCHDRTIAGHDQSAGDDAAGLDDGETDAIDHPSRKATGAFTATSDLVPLLDVDVEHRVPPPARRRRSRAVLVALLAVAGAAALAVVLAAGSLRPAAARLTALAIPAALPIVVEGDEAAAEAAPPETPAPRQDTSGQPAVAREQPVATLHRAPKARRPARKPKPAKTKPAASATPAVETPAPPPSLPRHRRPNPTRRRVAMLVAATAPCAATCTARRGIC